jgi:SAM-dependent methyltransferase
MLESPSPKCLVCYDKSNFLISKDKFDHNICKNPECLFIFVSNPPKNLNIVYKKEPDIIFLETSNEATSPDFDTNKNIIYAKKIITSNKISSLLDIGSRNGNFLLAIRNLTNIKSVVGVEPNTQAALHSKNLGIDVRNHFFSKDIFINEKFDLINIADVLEHVTDPRTMIKDAVSLLNNDGYLLIRTPNLSSQWSKITYKVSRMLDLPWSSLTPPEHISNFSNNNLTLFLRSESLEIVSKYYEPPNLIYELGQLHLVKKFRSNKSFRNLIKLFIGFYSYSLIFLFLKIVQPLLKENFSQTVLVRPLAPNVSYNG